MKKASPRVARKIGRPLSFDRDAALEQAMLLFWWHGYEATSLADLTKAMGVTPPSIYAAYGDKKGLFLEAVRRYLARPLPPAKAVEQAASAEAAARWLVEGAAVAFTGESTPPGCLLASSAIAVSSEADDIRQELATIRLGIESALRNKINGDIEAGKMTADIDAQTLAAFTMAIIQGLSTLARDGGSREKLLAVARFAMASWPKGPIYHEAIPLRASASEATAKA